MSAALRWVSSHDTGISSMVIWSHMMTGQPPENRFGVGHPHDADDFGRCYRLLALMPLWEIRLGEMAKYSAEWAALVERWPELKAMYEHALADADRNNFKRWTALCDTMRDLLTNARVCAECGKVGMSAWSTSPGDVKRCHSCAGKSREYTIAMDANR